MSPLTQDLVLRKDIFSDKTLAEFLELDGRVPEVLAKQPGLLGKHAETRSVMDLQYWAAQKMLFLASSDTTSFLAKSSIFSFGKKKDPVQTIGALQAFLHGKKDSKDIGDWNFEQQWWMNFPMATTALSWSEASGLLILGEDSGTMHFIKPSDSNSTKYEETFFLKVHTDRIVKIVADEERKLVYSIGEDRKFKETSIDKKRVNIEFEVSGKRPNCMSVDLALRLAYVGDSEGNVKIIDLGKNPPTCINNIKVNSKDHVAGIDISGDGLIYSGCQDTGKITVHHLADPKSSVVSLDPVVPADPQVHLLRLQGHHGHQALQGAQRGLGRPQQRRGERLQQVRDHRLSLL